MLIAWSIIWHPAVWSLVIVVPFIVLGIYDMIQTEHAITRNFPVFGHLVSQVSLKMQALTVPVNCTTLQLKS